MIQRKNSMWLTLCSVSPSRLFGFYSISLLCIQMSSRQIHRRWLMASPYARLPVSLSLPLPHSVLISTISLTANYLLSTSTVKSPSWTASSSNTVTSNSISFPIINPLWVFIWIIRFTNSTNISPDMFRCPYFTVHQPASVTINVLKHWFVLSF